MEFIRIGSIVPSILFIIILGLAINLYMKSMYILSNLNRNVFLKIYACKSIVGNIENKSVLITYLYQNLTSKNLDLRNDFLENSLDVYHYIPLKNGTLMIIHLYSSGRDFMGDG